MNETTVSFIAFLGVILKKTACQVQAKGAFGAEGPVGEAVPGVFRYKKTVLGRKGAVPAPGNVGIHITHIGTKIDILRAVPNLAEGLPRNISKGVGGESARMQT